MISMKLIIGVYFLLQLLATGFLVALEITGPQLAFHLILALITSGLYLAVHLRDVLIRMNRKPGYLETKEDAEKEV